jgi:hypothetical protein
MRSGSMTMAALVLSAAKTTAGARILAAFATMMESSVPAERRRLRALFRAPVSEPNDDFRIDGVRGL